MATTSSQNKKPPIDLLKKYSKQLNSPKIDDNFPVLKIEEDLDGITMHSCKTTSTQTSPVHEVNKKGSTSTIWTSEESILRSAADTVDEDNKSTSSSACDETAGVISSGKSG